jgi:hypothetical protein
MVLPLPKLRVGEPLRHEALSVFPLFAETCGLVAYRLSDEALADQSVLVEEISQGGSVPDLLVENKGDVRVLFLEGEELVGAKQNRILNTSVLVPAHTKLTIPVSCVEQGRWRYSSRYFGASGSHSPSKLRRALKASVSRSVMAKRGHTSDQGEVWKEVGALHAAHQVESGTGAMSDAFASYKDRIAAFTSKLKYVEGASGLGVAIGGRVISIDLFDKPSTCRKVWERLLSGVVFDALEAGAEDQHAPATAVEQLVAVTGDLPWEPAASVGEGQEYRAASPRGDHASALVLEGAVVHGSVVTRE